MIDLYLPRKPLNHKNITRPILNPPSLWERFKRWARLES